MQGQTEFVISSQILRIMGSLEQINTFHAKRFNVCVLFVPLLTAADTAASKFAARFRDDLVPHRKWPISREVVGTTG
jgi:hypothetical protein